MRNKRIIIDNLITIEDEKLERLQNAIAEDFDLEYTLEEYTKEEL